MLIMNQDQQHNSSGVLMTSPPSSSVKLNSNHPVTLTTLGQGGNGSPSGVMHMSNNGHGQGVIVQNMGLSLSVSGEFT